MSTHVTEVKLYTHSSLIVPNKAMIRTSFKPSSSIPVSLTIEYTCVPSSSPASILDCKIRASPLTNGHPGRRTTKTRLPTSPEVKASQPFITLVSSTSGAGLVANFSDTSVASCRSFVFIVLGIAILSLNSIIILNLLLLLFF